MIDESDWTRHDRLTKDFWKWRKKRVSAISSSNDGGGGGGFGGDGWVPQIAVGRFE